MNRDAVLTALQPELGFQIKPIGERPVVLIEDDGEGKITSVSLRPDRGGRSIDMTPDGVQNMMKRVGLGPDLAKKISTRTMQTVVGEALGRSKVAAMVKDHQCIDVVSGKEFRLVQPGRVLHTLEKAVPGCDFHRVLTLPNHVVHLETIGVEEKPVSRGDMIRAGVLTQFDVLGHTHPKIQTYVQRLACTNGATTNDIMGEFNFNEDGGDFEHWLRLKARQAYRSLEKVVTRWGELAKQTITSQERADYLAHWIKEARIPPEMVEVVHAQALENPPNNHYDMLNLVTWATSHLEMRPAEVSRSMSAIADLQHHEQHRRRCPVCNRGR